MNNKGNVWVIGLIVLQLVLVISTIFCINLDHLLKINQIDPSFECAKIKVIQKIKKAFEENKMKDFKMNTEGYQIEALCDVDQCKLIFDGEHHVEMNVEFDYAFVSIGSVEYDFEDWE